MLKRDYIQDDTHHSGMWGCKEGLNPKFQSLCSKNEAAEAPTPPQNDDFSIMCHFDFFLWRIGAIEGGIYGMNITII